MQYIEVNMVQIFILQYNIDLTDTAIHNRAVYCDSPRLVSIHFHMKKRAFCPPLLEEEPCSEGCCYDFGIYVQKQGIGSLLFHM